MLARSPVTAIWSGLLGHRVDGDGIGEQSLVHRAALALPIQIAKSALQVPIARVETGNGSEVQVGDVGKSDGIGHAVRSSSATIAARQGDSCEPKQSLLPFREKDATAC